MSERRGLFSTNIHLRFFFSATSTAEWAGWLCCAGGFVLLVRASGSLIGWFTIQSNLL
jgi:hypothetical protein